MGCGTVFELSPPSHKGGAWTETILYSFPNAKKGYLPNGDLVFDGAGNLYGATMFGGGRGTNCNVLYQYCGAIFELSPPKKKGGKWTEKVLYSFKGVNSEQNSGDGANPNGYLVLDSAGALYGTTYFGGNNQQGVCRGGAGGTGCGIVFKLRPPAQEGAPWTETILHRMKAGADDGSNPVGGLALDSDGNLFGATYDGPKEGYGTVFEVAKPVEQSHPWRETIVYRFLNQDDGGNPFAGVVLGPHDDLYGTTIGGDWAHGGVFRLRQRSGKWVQRSLTVSRVPPTVLIPARRCSSTRPATFTVPLIGVALDKPVKVDAALYLKLNRKLSLVDLVAGGAGAGAHLEITVLKQAKPSTRSCNYHFIISNC